MAKSLLSSSEPDGLWGGLARPRSGGHRIRASHFQALGAFFSPNQEKEKRKKLLGHIDSRTS